MDREEFLRQMLEYSASAGNIDENIIHILDYIGRKLEADRTYIFEKNKRGSSDNTYEWCAENVIPQKDNLQNITEIDIWYREFKPRKGIFIADIEEYKSVSYIAYEALKQQEIHSLIAWPIFVDEICVGFLGIDNPLKKHTEDIFRIFELVGYIMSVMIRHRDNVRMLRKLSYEDQLTGVKNRRELDVFVVSEYTGISSIGILSCDLNGLKKINDTLGHIEGDKYIKKLSANIAKIFGYNYVYRMGGDEFLAISINLTASDFEIKIKEMLELLKAENISVAVGHIFKNDNKSEFYSLMDMADKKMYKNKGEYYSNTKNERRRR